ncbi:hypothetical protein BX666DRAFT_1929536 [Dichotomocladium elegans]|nr:hypothetical protein BX666DRAFT_1929536 [Dichotomocladium elegans]
MKPTYPRKTKIKLRSLCANDLFSNHKIKKAIHQPPVVLDIARWIEEFKFINARHRNATTKPKVEDQSLSSSANVLGSKVDNAISLPESLHSSPTEKHAPITAAALIERTIPASSMAAARKNSYDIIDLRFEDDDFEMTQGNNATGNIPSGKRVPPLSPARTLTVSSMPRNPTATTGDTAAAAATVAAEPCKTNPTNESTENISYIAQTIANTGSAVRDTRHQDNGGGSALHQSMIVSNETSPPPISPEALSSQSSIISVGLEDSSLRRNSHHAQPTEYIVLSDDDENDVLIEKADHAQNTQMNTSGTKENGLANVLFPVHCAPVCGTPLQLHHYDLEAKHFRDNTSRSYASIHFKRLLDIISHPLTAFVDEKEETASDLASGSGKTQFIVKLLELFNETKKEIDVCILTSNFNTEDMLLNTMRQNGILAMRIPTALDETWLNEHGVLIRLNPRSRVWSTRPAVDLVLVYDICIMPKYEGFAKLTPKNGKDLRIVWPVMIGTIEESYMRIIFDKDNVGDLPNTWDERWTEDERLLAIMMTEDIRRDVSENTSMTLASAESVYRWVLSNDQAAYRFTPLRVTSSPSPPPQPFDNVDAVRHHCEAYIQRILQRPNVMATIPYPPPDMTLVRQPKAPKEFYDDLEAEVKHIQKTSGEKFQKLYQKFLDEVDEIFGKASREANAKLAELIHSSTISPSLV